MWDHFSTSHKSSHGQIMPQIGPLAQLFLKKDSITQAYAIFIFEKKDSLRNLKQINVSKIHYILSQVFYHHHYTVTSCLSLSHIGLSFFLPPLTTFQLNKVWVTYLTFRRSWNVPNYALWKGEKSQGRTQGGA